MERRKHVFMLRNEAEADILYTFFEQFRGVAKHLGDTVKIPQNVMSVVPYGELSSVFCALQINWEGLIGITQDLRFEGVYRSQRLDGYSVSIETRVASYESQNTRGERHPTLVQVYGDKSACVGRHPTLVQVSAKVAEYEDLGTCRKTQPKSTQVGGDHYSKMKVQPIDFITANGLGYIEGNIIKYVCRYKSKNGVEDLKKAHHYLQMLIEQEERGEGPK